MEKCRVAIYSRVSTLLGQTVENQVIPLRDYALRNGFTVTHEFSDEGISGAKARRPGLDSMLAAAQRKEFDIILIAALDRISRDVKNFLGLLSDLEAMSIQLVSLRENISPSTPLGRAFFLIASTLSELERNSLRERVKIAMATRKLLAQQNGTDWRCGRPPVLTETIKSDIIRLREQGQSIRSISKQLGKQVSPSSVHAYLKSRSETVL